MKRILRTLLHIILFPLTAITIAVILALFEYGALTLFNYFNTGLMSTSSIAKSDYLWLYWITGALTYPVGYSYFRRSRDEKIKQRMRTEELIEKSQKAKLEKQRVKELERSKRLAEQAKQEENFLDIKNRMFEKKSDIEAIKGQLSDQLIEVELLSNKLFEVDQNLQAIKGRHPALIKISGVDIVLKNARKHLKTLQKSTKEFISMSDEFYDADDYIDKYIEVIFANDDGDEDIYWVSIESIDADDEDAIFAKALKAHIDRGLPEVDIADAQFMEPFSRNGSEFTFVN